MTDPYISSLAFMGESPETMISVAAERKWSIEFSSGIPFRADMETLYLQAPLKKMPHNYFPAPAVPFVLNLASTNESIRNQSIEHCKKGLWLANQSHSPFFSAHAGFCIDPNPEELGKKITYHPDFMVEENKNFFIQSIQAVLQTADELNIDFLIENNVIAKFNLANGTNPLLCCHGDDINWLFKTVNTPRLGLLLDTAHLKVSCATLNLSLENELRKIQPYIRAIHHSDNDGATDDNQPLPQNYWFLRHMPAFSKAVHVLEVKKIDPDTIQQQIDLLLSHGR